MYNDAIACDSVEDWADFDYDLDGLPIVEQLDNKETTWVIAKFTPESGWEFSDPQEGQSVDFIASEEDWVPSADFIASEEDWVPSAKFIICNKDLIPSEVVTQWADY